MGGTQHMDPKEVPAGQGHAPSGPGQADPAERPPFGPRQGQTVRWDVVSGMAWNRPDPVDAHGGPLWAVAPGTPGSKWGPLKPNRGRNSDFRLMDQVSGFVNRLQDYGPLQVQRFLDIDWPKIVNSVTKEIFLQGGRQGALLSRPNPASPIGYGQAREFFLAQYGRLLEGREEAFGSTLVDYIFMEISARAGTCGDKSHYQVVDNGLL